MPSYYILLTVQRILMLWAAHLVGTDNGVIIDSVYYVNKNVYILEYKHVCFVEINIRNTLAMSLPSTTIIVEINDLVKVLRVWKFQQV